MKQRFAGFLFAFVLFVTTPVVAAQMQNLQSLVDAAKEGAVITPPAGLYKGSLKITKSIVIDGRGKVTIDGGGKGTVIDILADGVTIKGMHITGSGDQHNDIDAGIHIKSNYNVIKDNVITECLFGVDLEQASNNIVRRNKISSKADAGLGVKGDAVRLWYSFNNKIEENYIRKSRDFVIWYSDGNRIANNDIANGRYGLHFMYAKYNLVENNSISKNAVGIFLMYSDGVVVRNNRLFQAQGNAGVGIGLKETSNVKMINNQILYNSRGISLDMSPFDPDTKNEIYGNEIAFNNIGISFLSDWKGNVVKDNRFKSNVLPVTVGSFASAKRNIWEGNFWGSYEGFDRDKDGYGDTPYKLKIYSDRLWMDQPKAAFFQGTPVLSMLDFLERLAPFTKPLLMLSDKKPRISENFVAMTAKQQNLDQGQDDAEKKRLDPFGLDSN
jgi:nitrous oxidase accessory protein